MGRQLPSLLDLGNGRVQSAVIGQESTVNLANRRRAAWPNIHIERQKFPIEFRHEAN